MYEYTGWIGLAFASLKLHGMFLLTKGYPGKGWKFSPPIFCSFLRKFFETKLG